MDFLFQLPYIKIVNFFNAHRFEVKAMLGCWIKANCPLIGPGPIWGKPSVGGLSKGF